jgi:hypothetical protein
VKSGVHVRPESVFNFAGIRRHDAGLFIRKVNLVFIPWPACGGLGVRPRAFWPVCSSYSLRFFSFSSCSACSASKRSCARRSISFFGFLDGGQSIFSTGQLIRKADLRLIFGIGKLCLPQQFPDLSA